MKGIQIAITGTALLSCLSFSALTFSRLWQWQRDTSFIPLALCSLLSPENDTGGRGMRIEEKRSVSKGNLQTLKP
ncbi:hypothetical protein F8388_015370 [Cannabis sativa]|uniref:Uncharacterized protein n=1 Tax=Cannabis sativa TaxID=3483 RepID=A0A7J6GI36_CANSA|nr:hypothetical protein F8388_015370 [Cannabis sativa]